MAELEGAVAADSTEVEADPTPGIARPPTKEAFANQGDQPPPPQLPPSFTGKETPAAEQPGPADDDEPGLDDDELAAASALGLTEAEMKDRSPAEIRADMERAARVLTNSLRARMAPQQQQMGMPQMPPQMPPQQYGMPTPEQIMAAYQYGDLDKLDPDFVGEENVALVKGMRDHMARAFAQQQQQLFALATQLQRINQEAQRAENERFQQWHRDLVSEWGEDWSDVFGKDPYRVQMGSPQEQANRALVELAEQLAAATGMPAKSAYLHARNSLFADHQTRKTKEAIAKKLESAKAQTSGRPGGAPANRYVPQDSREVIAQLEAEAQRRGWDKPKRRR